MISELNVHLKKKKRYNVLSLIINSLFTSTAFLLIVDVNEIRSTSSLSSKIVFILLLTFLGFMFIWSLRKKAMHERKLQQGSEQFFMKKVIESEYLNPGRKQRYINILNNKVPGVNRIEGMVEFFIEEAEQAEYKKQLEQENIDQNSNNDEM